MLADETHKYLHTEIPVAVYLWVPSTKWNYSECSAFMAAFWSQSYSFINRSVSDTWTNVRLHVRWYTLWLRQTVICITLTRFGTLIFHLLHASKTTPMGSTSDRCVVFFSLHFNINIYFENLRHWISKCIKFIWRITHACISIWFESVRKCWIKFSLKKTKSKNKFSHGMSSMQLCM